MRPVEFILGFLLLLSLAGQLFGGPPSSGPYYATLIVWIAGSDIKAFLALFGVIIPQVLSFGALAMLVFLVWLAAGLLLFFGGLFGSGGRNESKA